MFSNTAMLNGSLSNRQRTRKNKWQIFEYNSVVQSSVIHGDKT